MASQPSPLPPSPTPQPPLPALIRPRFVFLATAPHRLPCLAPHAVGYIGTWKTLTLHVWRLSFLDARFQAGFLDTNWLAPWLLQAAGLLLDWLRSWLAGWVTELLGLLGLLEGGLSLLGTTLSGDLLVL